MILDDSTSAVDTKTDYLIRKAFREDIPEITKLIISQRISSIQDADRIIVMDDGKIDGIGTHEELLKTNQIYKEVYETQVKGAMKNESTKNRRVKADQETMKVLGRLIGYVLKNYRFACIFVLLFIIISSLASVTSSLFLKSLIDDYITPILVSEGAADFTPLFIALCKMAAIYGVGVLSTYLYARILINVAQGTMKRIRDDLFSHMEKLPIRYFDTNPHGDIMSVYTNDTDTLRQVISQSIPQFLASLITVVSVFISMCVLSLYLTFIVVIMLIVMKVAMSKIAGQSGVYFTKQQQTLGK